MRILPPPPAPSLPPAGPALVPTAARSPVTSEEAEITEEHLPSWIQLSLSMSQGDLEMYGKNHYNIVKKLASN